MCDPITAAVVAGALTGGFMGLYSDSLKEWTKYQKAKKYGVGDFCEFLLKSACNFVLNTAVSLCGIPVIDVVWKLLGLVQDCVWITTDVHKNVYGGYRNKIGSSAYVYPTILALN
eukprot:237826_1